MDSGSTRRSSCARMTSSFWGFRPVRLAVPEWNAARSGNNRHVRPASPRSRRRHRLGPGSLQVADRAAGNHVARSEREFVVDSGTTLAAVRAADATRKRARSTSARGRSDRVGCRQLPAPLPARADRVEGSDPRPKRAPVPRAGRRSLRQHDPRPRRPAREHRAPSMRVYNAKGSSRTRTTTSAGCSKDWRPRSRKSRSKSWARSRSSPRRGDRVKPEIDEARVARPSARHPRRDRALRDHLQHLADRRAPC